MHIIIYSSDKTMNPFKYYLCRSDKITKQRHMETTRGTNSGDVVFAKVDQFEFFSVVWDPPYWVNLAIEDVIDGKIGLSKQFLKCLIGMYSTSSET